MTKDAVEEIPSHMLEESLDLSSFSSEEKMLAGRRLALEYAALEKAIKDAEANIERWKKRRNELTKREIPEYFDNVIKTDRLGLPEAGVDIVVGPFYHANIQADWDADRREKGFEALDRAGHGDVIKTVLSIEFDKGDYEDAKAIRDLILQSQWGNTYEVDLVNSVPWNTLTALVKRDIESGKKVDLEALGATVGRVASIKKRK